jgi:hypothetical protein
MQRGGGRTPQWALPPNCQVCLDDGAGFAGYARGRGHEHQRPQDTGHIPPNNITDSTDVSEALVKLGQYAKIQAQRAQGGLARSTFGNKSALPFWYKKC